MTLRKLYMNSIQGRLSAEVFHGTACVYSLLERRLVAYFKPHDLTPVQFNALMVIKHLGLKQGINQNDIARHLIVSPSNTTRLIDRLNNFGLVERSPSQEDRRVKFVKITEKGTLVLDKVWHGFGETIQQAAHLLDQDELQQLSQLLLKWFTLLEQNQEHPGGDNAKS